MKKDVIIIGAGAAGLMCALTAGKRNRSVLVIDHAEKIGKKIRISGGGRCNFTNLKVSHENYESRNPHFCKSALARFGPQDFIAMVEKHGIAYYEKEAGQLFCEGSSIEIIEMLRKECDAAGVDFRLHCRVEGAEKRGHFYVSTNQGVLESASMVIATGGLSYPKIGATDIGHRLARHFGLAITPLQPALVPFTFHQKDLHALKELSGITIDAEVSCGKRRFRGNILFTHRGLSGPAVLQISLYWNPGERIVINPLPDVDAHELFAEKRRSRAELHNVLSGHLPRRFVEKWCELFLQQEAVKPMHQYTDKALNDIARKLHHWEITPGGTEGYVTAEVTRGGIDTNELSSKTMESKNVPGLFFAGEVIDVTGQLGGYNLHWAWASGYAAGRYV